jgi:NAD(P)-dependent dehydrogenase (short-subunit alcohol dehydrogenase family)
VIRLQQSIDSPRSRPECFGFAADLRNLPAWDPATLSVRKLSPGAPGRGSEYQLAVAPRPPRPALRYRVQEVDPPHSIVLRGEGEAFTTIDRIRFEALAAGTRIVYTADITPRRKVGAVTEQLLRVVHAGRLRRSMAGLRGALAAADAAPSPRAWRRLLDRSLLPDAAQFTAYGYRAARPRPIVDRLDGKTVVITGATSGVGRAAALWLARLGARLVLVGRDADRLADTKADIVADCGNADIGVQRADLALAGQVRALARRLLAAEPRIDVLVNNAGALFGARALTAEGLERSFAVNLLAPYLLTEALLPALSAGARIINVTSGGMALRPPRLDDLQSARGRYSGTRAYACAKRGLAALSLDWAERLAPRGITVQVMHPGWVDAPGGRAAVPRLFRGIRPWLRTPEQGADTMVWLAAAPSGAIGGGNFWLDRQPHLTDVLPGTTVHRKTRRELVIALDEAAKSANS